MGDQRPKWQEQQMAMMDPQNSWQNMRCWVDKVDDLGDDEKSPRNLTQRLDPLWVSESNRSSERAVSQLTEGI